MTRRHPDRDARLARLRVADYHDQGAGRWCQNCANWLGAPTRHIGLCETVHASTRPAEVCDKFARRGSSEVNST